MNKSSRRAAGRQNPGEVQRFTGAVESFLKTAPGGLDSRREKRAFGWKRATELIVAIAAWLWFMLAGCGGLGLMITTGPWPPTHGWFVLFSGLAAWPVTAWASKKYLRVKLPGRVRIGAAALFVLAGRLAVTFVSPGQGNLRTGLIGSQSSPASSCSLPL